MDELDNRAKQHTAPAELKAARLGRVGADTPTPKRTDRWEGLGQVARVQDFHYGARPRWSPIQRNAVEEWIQMAKSDHLPRILFGKTYVWLRSESGKLVLVSTAALNAAVAKAKKVVNG